MTVCENARAVIEAAYRAETRSDQWLDAIASAARRTFDDGHGVIAYEFTIARDGRVCPKVPVARGASILAVGAFLAAMQGATTQVLRKAHIDDGPYSSLSEAMGVDVIERDPRVRALGAVTKIRDFVAVKGIEADGSGVAIGAPLRSLHAAAPAARELWSLVGAHVAAARRIRDRKPRPIDGLPQRAGAVFDTRGRLLHAEGDALAECDAIEEGVRRRTLALADMERSLRAWTTLVRGAWSLVDFVDSDGRRFVVAMKSPPRAKPLRGLSARERAVAAYAALGKPPKMIAYELGLSVSSVRTLEERAMTKLGVTTRAELAARGVAAEHVARVLRQA